MFVVSDIVEADLVDGEDVFLRGEGGEDFDPDTIVNDRLGPIIFYIIHQCICATRRVRDLLTLIDKHIRWIIRIKSLRGPLILLRTPPRFLPFQVLSRMDVTTLD